MAGVTNISLSGVTIRGGATSQRGGGLCVSNSLGVSLNNCTLSNNTARLNGGGAYIVGSTNVSFVACMIASNKQQDSGSDQVYRYGGGIYAESSFGLLSNTTVKANAAVPVANNYMSGGGLSLSNGGWTLVDCVVFYNRVSGNSIAQGGGLHINGGTHRIRNGLIMGNDGLTGDGICLENGVLAVTHSTVYGNVGEGVRRTAGTLSISNSILWRNMSADVVGAATLGYVDTESGLSNGVNGCSSVDPLFENGFYLSAGSPCVDAGSMTAAAAGLDMRTTRSDGTLDSGTVDLGYHYPAGITVIADLYVAPSGLNSNDGLSWGAAFRAITKALSVATVGTRVHIAAGTYDTGVETFPLTMSQAGLQLLGTNCDETVINAAGSNQRAISVADVTGGRIEGITIKGGNTTGSGGGLNIFQASDFSITACVITNNRAGLSGGGAWLQNSPGVRFAGCVVAGNNLGVLVDWDLGYGGGLYANNSKGVISNCLIRSNHSYPLGGHAKTRGGGIALVGGYWGVSECEVITNRTAATLSFANGGALAYGAGIYVEGGTHQIRNSLIVGNDCYQGYDGYVGDGVYVESGVASVLNCTLVNNGGEGVRRGAGTLTVNNSILWNNGDDVVGAVALTCSDIEDGDSVGVNGCISNNPLFEYAATNNFRLRMNSPCVNTGSNEVWMATGFDLDGRTRVSLNTVDMGAYEVHTPGGAVYVFR
jgi:parallel beta-helix repeat protein